MEPEDPKIRDAIAKVAKAKHLYYNNKFKDAEDLMEDGEHPYYLVFKAGLCAQRAGLTFEREDIRDAVERIQAAKTALETFRRDEGLVDSLLQIVINRDLDQFTESDLHCEAAYAQMVLIKAMMDFIEGENMLNFIKGALGIKNSYQLYKELYQYMRHREQLGIQNLGKPLDRDFKSLVCFGYGVFTLYLSMIPQKVLNMLEMVGIHGDKAEGLDVLKQGEASGGTVADLNGMILLHYNLMVCPYARVELDAPEADGLLAKYRGQFPDSVIFNLFAGKREMTKRNPEKASKIYNRALRTDTDWEFIKFTLHLELCWSCMAVGNWEEAERHAKIQFDKSNRSKTFFSYLQLICHYHRAPNDTEALVALAQEVPKHQLVIAGKHLHVEKYCIRKARSFLKNKNFLFCPSYEMMYFFGLTSFCTEKRLAVMRKEVEQGLDDIEHLSPYHHQHKIDDWFLGKLLLADNARLKADYGSAKEILETALQSEDSLEVDHMLAPWAYFELAWLQYHKYGNMESSRTNLACARAYGSRVRSFTLDQQLDFHLHLLNDYLDNTEPGEIREHGEVFSSGSEYFSMENSPVCNHSHSQENSPVCATGKVSPPHEADNDDTIGLPALDLPSVDLPSVDFSSIHKVYNPDVGDEDVSDVRETEEVSETQPKAKESTPFESTPSPFSNVKRRTQLFNDKTSYLAQVSDKLKTGKPPRSSGDLSAPRSSGDVSAEEKMESNTPGNTDKVPPVLQDNEGTDKEHVDKPAHTSDTRNVDVEPETATGVRSPKKPPRKKDVKSLISMFENRN